MRNWIPKTQGAMTIRPGTKWFGSSLNDTGAEWIEFVASTDDIALLEMTGGKMRIWLGTDAHSLSLMSRPAVSTTVTLTDTGWTDSSTGGNALSTNSQDIIPTMTDATTSGVTISASSVGLSSPGWQAGDDNSGTMWISDPGFSQWLKFDFGSAKAITDYSVRAGTSEWLTLAPSAWTLQGNDVDTGTGWTVEDTRTAQTGWASGERREFTAQNDTGATAWRYWRLLVTDANGATNCGVAEVEMFLYTVSSSRAGIVAGKLVLNATAIGSMAKYQKRVIVSDTGTEHSLSIVVDKGPITIRLGSSSGDDDYIKESNLGTGNHNLSFTPLGNFYITMQSDSIVNKVVSSLTIGDTGTVEITSPYTSSDIDNIRYDQSADVVYVDCSGIIQKKIERRGAGRSWSIVDYSPNNGPFLSAASSSAKLRISQKYGSTRIRSDIPFFTPSHVGALVRMFHHGQSGVWVLGAVDAATDPIEMTGISSANSADRNITFSVSGSWGGTITFERSFDGKDIGFKPLASSATDTGTFSKSIDDSDDNIKIWFRAKITAHTSGAAIVSATYGNGGITGIARITAYNSNTDVDVDVLERFSDTGPTDNWQQGYWSDARGWPTAVALHGGRICHAYGGSLFLSVADDYENFDDTTIGDAAPIIRTLGSGPIDKIHYLVSLLRLIIGTSGAEIALRSSSLDEPVTPENSSAGTFSTQGSANMRAVKMDNRAIFTQRSRKRVFMIGAGTQGSTFGDYEGSELTLLVPDLLAAGVVAIAVQRQPDTRIHCVLGDGTVAILTYEPSEEVICWSTWETDGVVEKAAVLPGVSEDAVYYHIRRTINGVTKRYIEKIALESECIGDSGLCWLMDCAKSFSDTGRSATVSGFSHLAGETVVVWADDTGTGGGKDLSPDVGGVQTTYTVNASTGTIALSEAVHHGVAGLPYTADWKSTKLAYAAEAGTALSQMKRTDKIAFVLHETHNNGVFFGSDTGNLDPMPRMNDGARIDPDAIHATFDQAAMPFPGLWSADSRIHLRAKAPRPCTVLAVVPTVATSEKV